MNFQPNAITTIRAPKKRALSAAATASQAAYRRKLAFEVAFMEGQRKARARGAAVRDVTLAAYPAALELVRGLATRLAAGGSIPPSGTMVYRGERVRVSQTSFGRLFVETLDGKPIGASGYGAAWSCGES